MNSLKKIEYYLVVFGSEGKPLPLPGEQNGEPDGGGVEHHWNVFGHHIEQVAEFATCGQNSMLAKGVHVEVHRRRADQREKIGDGQPQQHQVGGRTHVWACEDADGERVGEECGGHQEGHDAAVHHAGVLDRHHLGDVHHHTVTAGQLFGQRKRVLHIGQGW